MKSWETADVGMRAGVGGGSGRAPTLLRADGTVAAGAPGRRCPFRTRPCAGAGSRCPCTAAMSWYPGSGAARGHRSQSGRRRRRAESAGAWAASSALCAPRTCSAPDGRFREDKGCPATRPVQAFRHSGERSRAPRGHARGLGSRPNGGAVEGRRGLRGRTADAGPPVPVTVEPAHGPSVARARFSRLVPLGKSGVSPRAGDTDRLRSHRRRSDAPVKPSVEPSSERTLPTAGPARPPSTPPTLDHPSPSTPLLPGCGASEHVS